MCRVNSCRAGGVQLYVEAQLWSILSIRLLKLHVCYITHFQSMHCNIYAILL